MPQPSLRVPNLLHLLLFLALTVFALLLSESLLVALFHSRPLLQTLTDQRLQLIANILAYLIAITAAWFTFPLLWNRSFLVGISWNPANASPWLLLAGLLLGFLSQAVTALLPTPKKLPMEQFFHNPATIWLLAGFGTLLAPLFEEILFRGFLLPAVAIAIDWLRLPRHPNVSPDETLAPLEAWRASDSFSFLALLVASILTSLMFALIHAPQLGYTWPAVSLLAAVSLVLCYIRLRTRSVAASTLIHASYNLSVFITLFVATGGFRHLDRV